MSHDNLPKPVELWRCTHAPLKLVVIGPGIGLALVWLKANLSSIRLTWTSIRMNRGKSKSKWSPNSFKKMHFKRFEKRRSFCHVIYILIWWKKTKTHRIVTWWRHQMETFSALLVICAGNSPVTGEFTSHRPVTRTCNVFIDLRLKKRLSKQSWGWWFETPSRPLWRHCNLLSFLWYQNFLHAEDFPVAMHLYDTWNTVLIERNPYGGYSHIHIMWRAMVSRMIVHEVYSSGENHTNALRFEYLSTLFLTWT